MSHFLLLEDGDVDKDDEDGRDDDGGSVRMLVEEDEDADEVNCCMDSDMENRYALPPISPRDSSVYSRSNQVHGPGLVSGETGDSNMGSVASGSQLARVWRMRSACGRSVSLSWMRRTHAPVLW